MGYYDDLDREVDHDLGLTPEAEQPDVPTRTHAALQHLSRFLAAVGRVLGKIVFFPVISSIRIWPRFDADGNPAPARTRIQRVLEGLATRLMLAPVILGLFFLAVVWTTTHPARVQAYQTPGSIGLYYQNVRIQSSDGQLLQAWYIAPLTADDVIAEGNDAILHKRPAAVIVHGLGLSHDQYLPLARQLHDAGFAVLMLSLRGQGESNAGTVTFGLRERFDVLAGVNYLRELPMIDPAKITLVGYGVGATAILHAAILDHSITTIALDGLWPSFNTWTRQIFSQPAVPTELLAPLYNLTFELAIRERTSELETGELLHRLHHQNVLFIARNAPDQPPLTEVLGLAAGMPQPHEVLVVDGSPGQPASDLRVHTATARFLTTSLNWTPIRNAVPESVQQLNNARIK